MSENQKGFAAFLAKKDIVFSAKRYGIDALGAMAQGLFASLLIGTILKTLGQQLGVAILVDIGTFAQAVTGPAMAVSIGYALKCPPPGAVFIDCRRRRRRISWAVQAVLWLFSLSPSLPQSSVSWFPRKQRSISL